LGVLPKTDFFSDVVLNYYNAFYMQDGLLLEKKPTYVLLSLLDKPTVLTCLFWMFVISDNFFSIINGLLYWFSYGIFSPLILLPSW
jgi:hypothetical protein